MVNPLHGDAQFNEFLRYTDLHRLCFGVLDPQPMIHSIYTPPEIETLALECHFHL